MNHTLIFVPIPTWTLPDQRVIGRVLVDLVSFLDHACCLGCPKSKAPFFSPLSKKNISLLDLGVPNLFDATYS